MKESKLSPFDGDLLAMIADITKVEPKVTENDNKFIVDVQPELTIPGETMEALGKAVAGRMNAVIDELADLNAVVFHSAAILGIPQRDLLEMAYDKVKGRQTDPNYKRTHQHEPNKGCGDCSNFMYEDVNGNGYCEAFKSEQRCGNLRCQEYKPKK